MHDLPQTFFAESPHHKSTEGAGRTAPMSWERKTAPVPHPGSHPLTLPLGPGLRGDLCLASPPGPPCSPCLPPQHLSLSLGRPFPGEKPVQMLSTAEPPGAPAVLPS